MRPAFRTAGRLLELDRLRDSLAKKRHPFPPLIHLLFNLFICSVSQRWLADDPDGVYLPMFIAVQCLLGVLITLAFVGRAGIEILGKTRLFPGSSTASYYFLLAGSLRRPEWYLFTAAGCIFPAFVHAGGFLQAAAITAMSALCVLTAQVLCCAVSVRLIRSSLPLAGLTFLAVIVMIAMLASVFVFGTDALASALPLAGWAASGILAFAAGDSSAGAADLALLASVLAAVVTIFRK